MTVYVLVKGSHNEYVVCGATRYLPVAKVWPDKSDFHDYYEFTV